MLYVSASLTPIFLHESPVTALRIEFQATEVFELDDQRALAMLMYLNKFFDELSKDLVKTTVVSRLPLVLF